MSHRSGQYSEYAQHHPHDHGRPFVRRTHSHPQAATTAPSQSGYTIVHAGKQVRFGPVVFWIVVGTVTLLGMWSAATATYFAFRDDVLTRLIARQAEMQYAYEDRIAELRARESLEAVCRRRQLGVSNTKHRDDVANIPSANPDNSQ